MDIPILRLFKWYRRWCGGRWARVSRLHFGEKWIKVSDECVERCEEDYRA